MAISKKGIRLKYLMRKFKCIVFAIIFFNRTFKNLKNNKILFKCVKLDTFNHQRYYKRKSYLPFQHDCNFKQFWNVMLIIMLLLTAVITPIRLSLIDDEDVESWYPWDVIFDIFFSMDIIVNFLSAFYDSNNQLVFRFKDIIVKYLLGWFFIDIISILPIDQFTTYGNFQKLTRLLRLPRLYRLTKIIKLSRGGSHSFLNKLSEFFNLNLGVKRILNILGIMLIMTHLAAVFFYFSARQSDFDQDTWVVRYNLQGETYFRRYITAYYWSVQTITTVGYGDIACVTVLEKLFAICWMLAGVGFYSITITDLSSLLLNMNQEKVLLQNILNDFEHITEICHIPESITNQVVEFYEDNFKENAIWGINTDPFMEEFRYVEYEELGFLLRIDAIAQVQIFTIDVRFTAYIFMNLHVYKLQKDEILYRQGDPTDEVFFLVEGQVVYMNSEGHELDQLQSGEMVGDMEVMQKSRRNYHAVSKTDVVLFICKASYFLKLLYQFPHVLEFQKQIIKDKVRQIKLEEKKYSETVKNFFQTPKKTKGIQQFGIFHIYTNTNNSTNLKEQVQRIQKFNCLYLQQKQQEILDSNNNYVIKRSKDHFKLFYDHLQFNVEVFIHNKFIQQLNENESDKKQIIDNQQIHASSNSKCNSSIIFPINTQQSQLSESDQIISARNYEQFNKLIQLQKNDSSIQSIQNTKNNLSPQSRSSSSMAFPIINQQQSQQYLISENNEIISARQTNQDILKINVRQLGSNLPQLIEQDEDNLISERRQFNDSQQNIQIVDYEEDIAMEIEMELQIDISQNKTILNKFKIEKVKKIGYQQHQCINSMNTLKQNSNQVMKQIKEIGSLIQFIDELQKKKKKKLL